TLFRSELGIIDDESKVRQYFMHGTSHYLGLDVHDAGTFGPLRPNTVLTVEPGIYIARDSDCDPKWWNIGIRIEDDIVVTEKGPINMSGALPRKAEEIERLVLGSP
ncbi:MAG TPA: Xaa-Pro aminopeptidase, partial [Bacteroidetes bacterium]|nr:Xaa-Pro aminopeptidase [Bacteroidota bacterium]